jgi:hypothetical protein
VDESLLTRLRDQDTFAVIEQIVLTSDCLEAAKHLHEIAKHLYWKEKNLPACIAMMRAGAQLGMTARETDHSRRYSLRSAAKAMCYDLASFTWPGWNESGIIIAASDLEVGLDAARANLRLGEELNKGDLPLSRAHWMLAAHLMAIQRYAGAIAHFDQAATYAEQADSHPDALLSRGFADLAKLLDRPDDVEAAARLQQTKADIAPLENGPFFVSQIETAASVFAPGRS